MQGRYGEHYNFMKYRASVAIPIIATVLASLFFALDLLLPLGVAGGVPYVAVVLLGAWLPRERHVLGLALATSALTLIGYLLSPSGGVIWMVLANRALALFAIWVSAILIIQRNRRGVSLAGSEASYRDLAQGSSQGLLIHRDFKPLLVNDAWVKIFGLGSIGEALALESILPLVPGQEQERFKEFARARAHGEATPSHYRYQAIRPDGTWIWPGNWEPTMSLPSQSGATICWQRTRPC